MVRKILLLAIATTAFSQETPEDNYFQKNFNNRIHLGYFSSYFDDNIHLLQVGYDAILKMIYINPQYNLFDVGLGLNGLLAYDMVERIQKDNFGHERPKNGRTTTGFELNWNIRLYVIPIPKIDSRIFAEGCGMSLVVYSRKFPDNRTYVNVGTNIGLGMEYPINNYKAYTILKWFHSSNGRSYENNPALNTVGIVTGLQF